MDFFPMTTKPPEHPEDDSEVGPVSGTEFGPGAPSDTTNASLPCPLCGRPGDPKFRPFCSQRCADVDLARWFSGTYRIAGESVEEEKIAHSQLDPHDSLE